MVLAACSTDTLLEMVNCLVHGKYNSWVTCAALVWDPYPVLLPGRFNTSNCLLA